MGVPQCRPSWYNDISLDFVPLGTLSTSSGSAVVFPNTHAHKVSALRNASSDRDACRRLVVFFVVNPRRRILSSADVKPETIRRSMTKEQAEAVRLDLMQERKQAKQDLNPREVELCEH